MLFCDWSNFQKNRIKNITKLSYDCEFVLQVIRVSVVVSSFSLSLNYNTIKHSYDYAFVWAFFNYLIELSYDYAFELFSTI